MFENLHINLCIVDQVFEWICTRVKIFQLSIVSHGSHCGVERPDHAADVNRLDIREVRECTGAWGAGGLKTQQKDN